MHTRKITVSGLLASSALALTACKVDVKTLPVSTNSSSNLVVTATPKPYAYAYVPAQYGDVVYSFKIDRASGEIAATPAGSSSTQSLPISTAASFDSKFLFSANYSANSVSSFAINQTSGDLNLVSHFALPSGSSPGWISAHPHLPVLYVALPGLNKIAILDIASDGNLSSRPLVNAGAGVGSFAISSSGSLLYAGEQNANQLGIYEIDAQGNLLARAPYPLAAGASPNQLELSHSGNSLYIANWGTHSVSQFAVHANGVTQLGPDVDVVGGVFNVNVSLNDGFVYAMQPYANQYAKLAVQPDGSLSAPLNIAAPGAVFMSFFGSFAYLTPWTQAVSGLAIEVHGQDPSAGVAIQSLQSSTPHRGMYQMTIVP